MLGTSPESIDYGGGPRKIKELCERLGEPVLPAVITHSIEEAERAARNIGYPVVLLPRIHCSAAPEAALPTMRTSCAK